MGLIKALFEETLNNRTKCNSWNDIYDSHKKKGNENVIILDDIYGMLILLSVGLSAALLIFVTEHLAYWSNMKTHNSVMYVQ